MLCAHWRRWRVSSWARRAARLLNVLLRPAQRKTGRRPPQCGSGSPRQTGTLMAGSWSAAIRRTGLGGRSSSCQTTIRRRRRTRELQRVVGEAGSDDNRHLGGDRRCRSFDLHLGGCGFVDEHPSLSRPLPAARPRRMPQKAMPSSSRVCMSAVGWSGSAGSTRSSWIRRGHRLATYELSGRTGAGSDRYQRLTPVVALRIHSPEVRS